MQCLLYLVFAFVFEYQALFIRYFVCIYTVGLLLFLNIKLCLLDTLSAYTLLEGHFSVMDPVYFFYK